MWIPGQAADARPTQLALLATRCSTGLPHRGFPLTALQSWIPSLWSPVANGVWGGRIAPPHTPENLHCPTHPTRIAHAHSVALAQAYSSAFKHLFALPESTASSATLNPRTPSRISMAYSIFLLLSLSSRSTFFFSNSNCSFLFRVFSRT